MKPLDYRDRTALVTGASMGIGAVFAQALAERGANLVLVARSRDKLEALSATLAQRHGVRSQVIVADLSKPSAAQAVLGETRDLGLAVDILINNAGFGTYGRFEEISAERQHEEVMLNCAALIGLTHAFLPGMLQRESGAIIHLASLAALQPVPYMAVYGATKAFVLSFSEALWAENRARGVRVLALCPGATETAFFDTVGAAEAALGPRMRPEVVVSRALRALERGRSYVIPGASNYLLAQGARVLPRATMTKASERVMRPRRK